MNEKPVSAYVQDAPICIYTIDPSWSMVLFHRDFLPLSFEEFCLYIVIPKVEQLQSDVIDVKWGYVSDCSTAWKSLDDQKAFLLKEIKHAKTNV